MTTLFEVKNKQWSPMSKTPNYNYNYKKIHYPVKINKIFCYSNFQYFQKFCCFVAFVCVTGFL